MSDHVFPCLPSWLAQLGTDVDERLRKLNLVILRSVRPGQTGVIGMSVPHRVAMREFNIVDENVKMEM